MLSMCVCARMCVRVCPRTWTAKEVYVYARLVYLCDYLHGRRQFFLEAK